MKKFVFLICLSLCLIFTPIANAAIGVPVNSTASETNYTEIYGLCTYNGGYGPAGWYVTIDIEGLPGWTTLSCDWSAPSGPDVGGGTDHFNTYPSLAPGYYRIIAMLWNDLNEHQATLTHSGAPLEKLSYKYFENSYTSDPVYYPAPAYKYNFDFTAVPPTISGASYNPLTNQVTVTGTNFGDAKSYLSFGKYITNSSPSYIDSWSDTSIVLNKFSAFGQPGCFSVWNKKSGWYPACFDLNTAAGIQNVILPVTVEFEKMTLSESIIGIESEVYISATKTKVFKGIWGIGGVYNGTASFQYENPTNQSAAVDVRIWQWIDLPYSAGLINLTVNTATPQNFTLDGAAPTGTFLIYEGNGSWQPPINPKYHELVVNLDPGINTFTFSQPNTSQMTFKLDFLELAFNLEPLIP